MNRPFYHLEDPFCENREPEPKVYTLDLFYHRLFKIKERLFTETAKNICDQREKILHVALQLGTRILSFAALILFQQGQLISQHGRLLLSMLQLRPQLHAVAFRLRWKG